jgi:hypothetical protein
MASNYTGHLHRLLGTAADVAHGAPPTCVAADCSRPRGLLHRSVFVVIARDFTDNVAINSELRVVIQAMACPAPPSV